MQLGLSQWHVSDRQTRRGSAFPDVCCSFDLLLQLKLHPPSPLARSLAATVLRVKGQRPHPPQLLHHQHQPYSPDCPAAHHQLTSLTPAPPGPTDNILPILPFTIAFDPLRPPLRPQCP
ncbi:hypothetical protein CHARACLAT_000114 [Characodon lateralis]|uniref:Uncharacterized protein n=1 Tax=Characodon lateralis TaxID=208331 RepID=A0ABU7DQ49_9TELE|nr:hypothetical protein [Characodon lateralis]